jgi:acyl-CoA synthetase (AMP-forming)/AMP-acid ligase II
VSFSSAHFYIDGQRVSPSARRERRVVNPATEEVFGVVCLESEADVAGAVAAARRAFPAWSNTIKQQRIEMMQRIISAYATRLCRPFARCWACTACSSRRRSCAGTSVFSPENGYLRLTDRKTDMFIVGCFNCYPAEIEKMMCANPQYAQVAVIGVPDDRMGEVGKAFVVARPGFVVTCAEVIAWCREAMANYKVPRYVDVVPSLPTNSVGKVLKFKLREEAAAERSGH